MHSELISQKISRKGMVVAVMYHNEVDQYPKLFIAGDSTAASYSSGAFPMMGWGQVIQYFLRDVCVVNLAQCGRSSKSFIDEGWFRLIEERIGQGDYLFVQFGHNDEKSQDPARYTTPWETFPACLKRYVDLARGRGAHPVLITPVARRRFENGHTVNTHGAYPDAIRALAREEGVPCVDLSVLGQELMDQMGEEGSKALFTKVKPGEYPGYPEGHDDDTHFCQQGAIAIAALVAREVKKAFPESF